MVGPGKQYRTDSSQICQKPQMQMKGGAKTDTVIYEIHILTILELKPEYFR